ncbi:P-type ATPase [Roseburia sp. OM02-15]|uniref:P-type ATPase n=1 Tax=Roseburia sp. OM02-15 TaxID=2292368 RepID=UPI001FA9C01F
MIQLVQSADAGKTKIVGIADRWATWIVVIALSVATFICIISGELIRTVTILVVFCPCALVLATPTAIMAAIGNATKHGFLVRASIGKSSSKLLQRVLSEKSAGSRNV